MKVPHGNNSIVYGGGAGDIFFPLFFFSHVVSKGQASGRIIVATCEL